MDVLVVAVGVEVEVGTLEELEVVEDDDDVVEDDELEVVEDDVLEVVEDDDDVVEDDVLEVVEGVVVVVVDVVVVADVVPRSYLTSATSELDPLCEDPTAISFPSG
jgi:hypothetical protein